MSVVLLGDLGLVQRPQEHRSVVVLVVHLHYHPRLGPCFSRHSLHHQLVLRGRENVEGVGEIYIVLEMTTIDLQRLMIV